MSGFAGFISRNIDKEQTITKMINKISHRGPNGSSKYTDETIALGLKKLEITSSDNQPLFNETNTMTIVFDGRLYNSQSIKNDLQQKGHVFKTNSDMEIILHGYEEYKELLLPKLRGAFAFAIWDKVNKELFGARDIFGIKPFYYGRCPINNTFIFGSEIKSFIDHPDFVHSLNEKVLEHYLTFQCSPTEETMYKGILKLPPANYFKFKNDNVEVKSYETIDFYIIKTKSEAQTIDDLNQTLQTTINLHKLNDLEIGSFLTSDIESSYITHLANINKTFTVTVDNDQNTIFNNTNKLITKEEYFATLPKVLYAMDEPLANAAAVPLYLLGQEAVKSTKVIFSSYGADELFAGYNIYQEHLTTNFYTKLPFAIKNTNSKILSIFSKEDNNNYFIKKGRKVEDYYYGHNLAFDTEERKQALLIKTTAEDPTDITKPLYEKVKDHDDIIKMQYIDMNLGLPNDSLLMVDKMSMASSLEVRLPFLDKEVLALAETIPTNYKIDKETKHILRLAANRIIPTIPNINSTIPLSQWLKEDDIYNTVKTTFSTVFAKETFKYDYLIQLIDDHKKGKKDNTKKIWTIYTLLIWYQECFQ